MKLQKKMAKGSMWSVVEKGGQQFVSFFLFMVIARLVGPEEYGLAMLCFIFLSFSNLLLLGMADGVVSLQLKGGSKLSTLFWTIILTGSVLSMLCFIAAEPVADAFGLPPIKSLIEWFSPVPFLMGLMAVPHMLVMQKMDFKVYAICSLIATTGSGITGVALAFHGYGAFAIIIQQVVLYVLTNVILWFYVDWRPSLSINIKSLKEAIKPGLNMMGLNTLSFVELQIPRLFLGHFLGPVNVGYYSFAFRMRFALQEILVAPALTSLFPVLSQIKDNKTLQDEILENLFFLIGLVVFPIVILATLTAPFYVPLLFGDKWLDAIPLLQAFLFLGIVAPFVFIATAIFRSYNKVDVFARVQFLIVFLFIVITYIASQYNLIAVGLSVFAFEVLRVPVLFFLIKRTTGLNVEIYIKAMFKSIFSTIVMGLVVYAYINSFSVGSILGDLSFVLLIGFVVYSAVSMLLQRDRIYISIDQIKALIADSRARE